MKIRPNLFFLIWFSLVGCGFSLGQEGFPGSGIPWKSIKLTPSECEECLRRAKTAFDPVFLDDLVKRWEDSLKNAFLPPPPPPDAIEMAMLDFYRNELGYDAVNRFLRGEKNGDKSPEAVMAVAKLIASALNRLPQGTTVAEREVYRGAPLESEVLARFVVGENYLSHSFMSTSSNPPTALKFATGTHPSSRKQVFFTILSRTGRLVNDLGGYEKEIIFLPETSFKVKSKGEKAGDAFIEMEEIP